jgi:hypothetical protein
MKCLKIICFSFNFIFIKTIVYETVHYFLTQIELFDSVAISALPYGHGYPFVGRTYTFLSAVMFSVHHVAGLLLRSRLLAMAALEE